MEKVVHVWAFRDAPQFLQNLCNQGGDEDWIVCANQPEQNNVAQSLVWKLEVCSSAEFDHPLMPGVTVFVTTHA